MACAECFPCLALPKIPQSSSFLSWKPFEGRTRKTTWGKLVLDSSASLIDAQTHSLIPTLSHLLHSSSPTNILTLSFSHVHTHTHTHTHTRTHTRTRARTHARAHARTRAHTHAPRTAHSSGGPASLIAARSVPPHLRPRVS